MKRALSIAVLLALLGGCGGQPGKKPTPPPAAHAASGDFLGIYADDVFFGDDAYRAEALAAQRKAGFELIRQPFAWAEFQKDPARFDAFVEAAARAGMHVLPTVLGPQPGSGPSGGSHGAMDPPSDPAAFARYAAALVERYGPKGTFWKQHPGIPAVPIHSWQVWNEPNIPAFWGGKPDPGAYAALLKAASTAIRRADPGAEVVTAGLPTSHLGIPAADYLKQVYPAAKGSFDTVAVHPYAPTPDAVLTLVDEVRKLVPGAKVWVTEIGWGTGGKPGPLTVTPDTQATYLAETIKRLRAENVRGVVVFQWRDPKPYPGRREIWPFHAGLLDKDGTPKPALKALPTATRPTAN